MAAPTLETILDNLSDFADYEEVGSVSRARSFITAAKRYLQLPTSKSAQGSSLGYDHESVRQMLGEARAYVQANATTAGSRGVRHLGAGAEFR